MAELKDLRMKRGSLKTKLTLLEKYLNKIDSNTIEVDLENLEVRLNNILPIIEEFDSIQNEIECLCGESEAEINEHEEFQDKYFNLISRLNKTIKNNTHIDAQSYSGSVVSDMLSRTPSKTINITLPTINLPTFDGNVAYWREFSDAFVSLIHSNDEIPDGRKLNYLKSSLKGEPADLLRPLEITNDNYAIAWEKLNKKYNNKRKIIYNHVRSLLDIPIVVKESVQGLQKFINSIETHIECLKTWELPVDKWDALIIPILLTKLDIQLNKEWESKINRGNDNREYIPTLNEFLDFLNNKLNTLDAICSKRVDQNKNAHSTNKNLVTRSFATLNVSCIVCNGEHTVSKCDDFSSLSNEERNSKARELKLCINCLRKGHFVSNCLSRNKCRVCSKKHHTLLHYANTSFESKNRKSTFEFPSVEKENTQGMDSQVSVNCTSSIYNNQTDNKHGILPTARIHVLDSAKKTRELRVLLDSASQSNFISEDACKLLQLRKENISINVTGINEGNLTIKHRAQVTIQSKYNKFKETITCLVVPKITNMLPTHALNVANFKIPENINLADPTYYVPGPIDMLIGANLFWDLICIGQIKKQNFPILQKTKLGWIVSGSINQNQMQVSNKTFLTMDTLHEDVERFWKTEELITKKKENTIEEQYCLDLYNDTTTRDSDGRFVVRIPFKNDLKNLGDSFETARIRFLKLEERFIKNDQFKNLYSLCMQDYIKQGHMTECDNNEPGSFYLPHHAVYKESSQTTKLRVVFDGSCRLEEGLSVNQLQHPGPTLQEDLFSIMIKFRIHRYVLTGDITQMYRQILVHPDDRKHQKILWRDNPDEPLRSFELNRVTFGMTSAPFLAIRCLMQLADENQHKYPKESQIIREDFYVDDMITGCNDLNELKEIKINIQNILKTGGFVLRKFNSNIKELRDDKPSLENRENRLNMYEEGEKTLGIKWNPNSDMFSYNTLDLVDHQSITKRTILAQTAKLFDPLGLLSPIIIVAKILLQELWQLGLDWDETVPLSLHTKWLQFKEGLRHIHKIKIKRQAVIEQYERIELHTFADASEKGYGACIYIKSVSSNGIESNLLAAKSRVAPLKTITLPRLELCAAVVAAQLADKFRRILNLSIDQEYFWSDSKIVLAWINAEPNKYKTFVANRISEIQGLTKTTNWHHVKSSDNPADLISRGVTTENLIDLKLWWNGPNWLRENPTLEEQQFHEEILIEPPERKTTVLNTFINMDCPSWFPIERFSSFIKVQRVMAYVLRFITNCKLPKATRKKDELEAEEISNACVRLVKIAQIEEFTKEMNNLKNNKPLDSKSKILNLVPFIDSFGILRVGGRLELSSFPYNKKHPMLLPRSHHLTNLIFRYEHLRTLHAGPNQLLAVVRDNYWPIAGKITAKKIIRQCMKCTRLKGKTNQQIMGQLPLQRTLVTPPFHSTGVDYAGPYILKDRNGRGFKIYKAYICLFICFSTKAIHLELVSELTSDAFISTLKRFIARRGKPLHIFSDNGTNFIGAIKELSSLNTVFVGQENEIKCFLSSEGISWHLIPPRAPNFGGLWEAAVKSMKHHLKRVLNESPLTFEDFYTILTQIESILNSRPLTPLTTDPNDCIALTPGHFLVGRPLVAIPDLDVRDIQISRLDRYQHLQLIIRNFWDQWQKEYINHLQVRSKWTDKGKSLTLDDLVIIKEDNTPPAFWKLGRIIQLHPGQDGVIRVVTVKCQKGVLKRPVNKVCVLPINND